ncbi:hypothetical protein BpHYR1_043396 [Brachionus plicatilis]|uniref:Uncharacterized protein n=1 Tax=Brachionus plicatilis TaxID=10195 RepID=A0A3M7RKX4_BRAPC|nr:hypothetical protein BpHYR1_043396 [Brachionus plicatilis]
MLEKIKLIAMIKFKIVMMLNTCHVLLTIQGLELSLGLSHQRLAGHQKHSHRFAHLVSGMLLQILLNFHDQLIHYGRSMLSCQCICQIQVNQSLFQISGLEICV